MRLNTINRQMNEMIEKINVIKNTQSLPLKEQINTIICKMYEITKYPVNKMFLLKFLNNFKSLIIFAESIKKDDSNMEDKEEMIELLEDKILESQNKLKL